MVISLFLSSLRTSPLLYSRQQLNQSWLQLTHHAPHNRHPPSLNSHSSRQLTSDSASPTRGPQPTPPKGTTRYYTNKKPNRKDLLPRNLDSSRQCLPRLHSLDSRTRARRRWMFCRASSRSSMAAGSRWRCSTLALTLPLPGCSRRPTAAPRS